MISLILPIYNIAPYLSRCINSILSQSFQDFEMILVDDGSTDGSGAICDRFAAEDSRIHVLHKENGGLSDARNVGLQMASGEFIAFIDSDDWVASDFLRALFETMKETCADICECDVLKISDEVIPEASGTGTVTCFEAEDALRELINDGVFHQHVWNKLYRRSCLAGILFEVGKTNEDEFWTYQVFGRAKKIAKIERPLYYYFQRPGSIMGSSYSLKRLDALEAKTERQQYVEAHFPALSGLSRSNLFGYCIYAGQMSLKHLEGEDLQTAKHIITKSKDACPLRTSDLVGKNWKQQFWLRLASVSFWGTVRLKNLLRKGF